MGIDRATLEEAGRLLLGNEWKRPLAKLLGPHHPAGARESLDPRLPFRWASAPQSDPSKKDQCRPVPDWVGPALSKLLAERADTLIADADRARALSDRLRGSELMRWFPRSVMPNRPPFVVAGAEPADLRVAMEARHFEDGLTLSASPIWQVAPLTKAGRAAILRTAGETVRACLVEGWHVRRPGEKDASALVLKLTEHFMHGRLVSAAPERAALRYTDRLLVVTPRLVFSVQGSDPGQAFGRLADFYIGTRRAPRRRARPLPEGDAEALGWLQAEPPRSPDASPIQE